MSTPPDRFEMTLPEGKTKGEIVADLRLAPITRHAITANALAARAVTFADEADVSTLDATLTLKGFANDVAAGDLRHISDTLLSQSVTLDTTMIELMRRAWANASEHPQAFDRYMAMALKAQAQSRATLEALAKIHQPREQVVRHVHVHEGGQAVVAEEFHHHAGGQNAGSAYQAHEQYDSRPSGTALPCPDPSRNGVPVPGSEGPEKVPHARRREGQRGTARQPKRAQARAEIG